MSIQRELAARSLAYRIPRDMAMSILGKRIKQRGNTCTLASEGSRLRSQRGG